MLTCDNAAVEREHAERPEGSEVMLRALILLMGTEIVATYASAGQLRDRPACSETRASWRSSTLRSHREPARAVLAPARAAALPSGPPRRTHARGGARVGASRAPPRRLPLLPSGPGNLAEPIFLLGTLGANSLISRHKAGWLRSWSQPGHRPPSLVNFASSVASGAGGWATSGLHEIHCCSGT
jgi:hypothetical protein